MASKFKMTDADWKAMMDGINIKGEKMDRK